MSLQGNIRNLRLKLSGAPVIHCLGDSHLAVFEYINKERLLKKTAFEFCIVHGATAMGIPNPASKTQAGPIFENYLKKVSKKHYILTCLGEVDCGFVIWYRSKKYDDPTEKQFELAVGNYTNFLNGMLNEGRKRIIVCSDDKFLNPDKLDHHLFPEALAEVIVDEMNRNGFK